MSKKVIILAEMRDGELRQVSYEAIAAAQQIANGGEVVATVLGERVAAVETLIHYGADRVVKVEDPALQDYRTDAYQQAFLQVMDIEQPEVVVAGHTALGKDLSPRIAQKAGLALISDVVKITDEGNGLLFTRPIYAGKAFEKKKADGALFVTIRPNNIEPLDVNASRTGDIRSITIELKDIRTTIKNIVRKATGGVDLSEAKIVVAGGRGLKSKEGFKTLEEFAKVIGAAVGASRGACDAEYCEYALQIGQTGKVVTPDLYFAIGISGAIQHVAGMSNSKVIVAINKDPEAPIFEIADYSIVGDLFDVLPILTKEFKVAVEQK